uniref:MrfA-like Zn-binding domain-containing protein n=1 Tax=Candidatus Kentrum sp. DK TaxID=2126562 RepID=A0A450SC70_9GAMM|nr:MAG: protein of unknown function (DUF1998) [Candidatus Kentron sp. DK]
MIFPVSLFGSGFSGLGFAVMLVALGLAIFFHLLARHRKIDPGPVWASTLFITLSVMLPLLFGSYALQWAWQPWWHTGRHLLPELVGPGYNIIETLLALTLPMLPWLAGLLWRTLRGWPSQEAAREAGRWIVGAIAQDGARDSAGMPRLWVAWFSLLPILVMLGMADQLGANASPYPVAIWSTLGLVSIALIGIALSKPIPTKETAPPVSKPKPPANLPSWPEEMAHRGVALTLLGSCASKQGDPGPEPSESRKEGIPSKKPIDADSPDVLGASGISPVLSKAMRDLAAPYRQGATIPMRRLVIASDDSGQAENLVPVAVELHRRFGTITLVIVATDADGYAAKLARWMDGEGVKAITKQELSLPENVIICVVDAVLLSDRLLAELDRNGQIKRIGLLCWWDLHRFSGVVAANLWAIARRLKRLLDSSGRPDIRVLATIRDHANAGSQRSDFVSRLLPYEFPNETIVHLQRDCRQSLALYRVDSTTRWRNELHDRHIDRNLISSDVLTTTLASVDTGWPTHVDLPPGLQMREIANFGGVNLGKGAAGRQLVPSANAGARILMIDNDNASSVLEVSRQGGRNVPAVLPHHVALAGGPNPYANWLGEYAARKAGTDDDALVPPYRLICPGAQSGIIRRHLLRALHEREDTLSGLLRHFLWDESAVRETLEALLDKGMLHREQVRHVNEDGRLIVENSYQNRALPDTPGPLDTVGDSLVRLFDPEITEGDNVLGWLDSERLGILGYPGRIFLQGGVRYRIADWRSSGASPSALRCDREDRLVFTCRVRRPQLRNPDLRPGKGHDPILWEGKAEYVEFVTGYRYRVPSDDNEGWIAKNILYQGDPISARFNTDVLVMGFQGEISGQGLNSLTQALRHVLPVHAGIDEDAVEIVPIHDGLPMGNKGGTGVAIADLYPGGIGIIREIGKDTLFIKELFDWTARWLAACSCPEDGACPRCIDSFTAGAITTTSPNSRGEVLNLLARTIHRAGDLNG